MPVNTPLMTFSTHRLDRLPPHVVGDRSNETQPDAPCGKRRGVGARIGARIGGGRTHPG